ncbi:YcaO-like family protein [Lactobacillus intestinalis]|uniref:YcaO domain-containing protein n=1 Tax=Lactobacillus intestinalis DSM 6629 TaxID=1423761 RepID=A0ABR5PTF3_9LACO|nr:YcaO-like family protein [Lactobacillus intestinalis]KRM34678.1 hypothetical protein FC44_GL000997 [Lactobacillus intestinalis DSM 6629]UTW41083.1 YcaO-like family protein [Lactobacillus intestinalis]
MLVFQNDLNYNLYRQKLLGGNVSGIWKNNVYFLGASSYPIPKYHYLTAQFNNFEKNIFHDHMSVNYHLSGYGTEYNEALASFLGESSERYSFTLLYKNIKNQIIHATYNDLKKKFPNDLILDLSLINVYFKKKDITHYIEPNDLISWVPMYSLLNSKLKVYVPLQMVVLFDKKIFNKEKRFLNSAVSTGTASQETFKKSIQNAIIEILQIDSYNLWWYGGFTGTKLDVNIKELLQKWFNNESVNNFIKKFDVKFTDISFDKPIPIVVCEISAKDSNLPKYVVGVQGGLNLNKCLYRGFLEALTVLEYCFTTIWNNTEKFKNIKKDISKLSIDNLDDNVIYYAKYGIQNLKRERKCCLEKHKKVNSFNELIKSISKFSKFACYLNITPVEFYNKNFVVSRVLIPELLSLPLPSFPPYYHPRYANIGGILNYVPHPMA